MRKSFLLLASLGAALAQAAPPEKLELTWELTKDGGAVAEIVQAVRHGGGRYEIVERWQGRGLYRIMGTVKRHSRGAAGPEGLRPDEFSDERSGRDPERAAFDWKAKTVTYQYKGPPTTIPLPAHPTDDLAALFSFSFHPPRDTVVPLDVVTGRGVSDRIFRNEGRERFVSPAGEFEAVKLVRRKEGSERAEIWLAANRGFLPVRILIVDKKGARLDQVLTRIGVP